MTGVLPGRSRGFTLLEVLVSMTLLTVILSICFGALRLSSRSWEAAETRSDELAQMRIALDFLRRQIAQTLPRRWRVDNADRIAFAGDERRLLFIAPAPYQQAGAVGLYQFLVELQRGDDASSLVVYYEPYYPGTAAFGVSDASPRSVLLERVERAEFSFFGAPRDKQEAEWRRAWDLEAERFPRLIRLTLHPGVEGAAELTLQFGLLTDGEAG